jgi:hypothetical protein
MPHHDPVPNDRLDDHGESSDLLDLDEMDQDVRELEVPLSVLQRIQEDLHLAPAGPTEQFSKWQSDLH